VNKAFVRLENTNDNHYKFYEMTMKQSGSCFDVVVKYGKINTEGKTIFLRGPKIRGGEAEGLSSTEAEAAFLEQLKKKFRDKEYTLRDLSTDDENLKTEIENVQCQFDGYNAIAVRLEERGF